jgi:hypothetical protein
MQGAINVYELFKYLIIYIYIVAYFTLQTNGYLLLFLFCFIICIHLQNWSSSGLLEKMKKLSERRKLEDLTVGPVLTVS